MPIVEPIGESDRQREARIALAKKALHLRAINRRTDGNGFISPEDSIAAAREAGVAPPPEVEAEIAVTRLKAGLRHKLTEAQVEAMTAATPEAAEAEAATLAAAPGDAGARTDQPTPAPTGLDNLRQRVVEAERSGDAEQVSAAKGALLQALSDQQ